MIATAPSKRTRTGKSPAPTHRSKVHQEAVDRFLRSEIPFIPNRQFASWLSRGRDVPAAMTVASSASRGDSAKEPSPAVLKVRSSAHYERLCGVPLLTPAEEKALFCRMNYLKFQANRLRLKLLRNQARFSEYTRCQSLLNEAYELRNRIVHANVRLVVSIARQVANSKNSMDELVSEGITCMMKAVDKFDFNRGFRFSTYATRSIRRELWRFIRRNHKLRTRWVTSLDERLNAEELPEVTEPPTLDEWMNHEQTRPDNLKQQLSRLDERERFIVDARFGFTNLGRKPTFQTLGKLLGVSKERARQLEQRAMMKLRDGFGVVR
jgi:RNA polymerase primary sigma factor